MDRNMRGMTPEQPSKVQLDDDTIQLSIKGFKDVYDNLDMLEGAPLSVRVMCSAIMTTNYDWNESLRTICQGILEDSELGNKEAKEINNMMKFVVTTLMDQANKYKDDQVQLN